MEGEVGCGSMKWLVRRCHRKHLSWRPVHCFIFYAAGVPPSPRDCATHIKGGPCPQLRLSGPQGGISKVSLDPVKLTVRSSHHSGGGMEDAVTVG